MSTRENPEFESPDWPSPNPLREGPRKATPPFRSPTKVPAVPPRDVDASTMAREAGPLRDLFRAYRGPDGDVAPAAFLRMCRERRISPDLLTRQECTRLCRLELGPSGGLGEARFGRAFHRVAAAAFGDAAFGGALDSLLAHVAASQKPPQPSFGAATPAFGGAATPSFGGAATPAFGGAAATPFGGAAFEPAFQPFYAPPAAAFSPPAVPFPAGAPFQALSPLGIYGQPAFYAAPGLQAPPGPAPEWGVGRKLGRGAEGKGDD